MTHTVENNTNLLKIIDSYDYPWQVVEQIQKIVHEALSKLDDNYTINNNIAIHKSSRVDPTAKILAPAIIEADCFIGPHTLLRGGVYIGAHSSIGPGCEVKSTVIGENTALAHFNFVGDSVVGSRVNLEAGAVIANHYNERSDKTISVLWEDKIMQISSIKFGAYIGDGCKIGANAVTSPGTILTSQTIVRRLELVEQIPKNDIY